VAGVTIDGTVRWLMLAFFAGLLLAAGLGWRQVMAARHMPYYLLRRERMTAGWRTILLGLASGVVGLALLLFGRPVAYTLFPPTPTLTLTPTITVTPTITLTPTITSTPTITATGMPTLVPTDTATPVLPEGVTLPLLATVTPNPDAGFGPIQFATSLHYPPSRTSDTFGDPQGTLYGIFEYNYLDPGVPWTAIWYRGTEIICLEAMLWEGSTGGYGYTECTPDQWLPGEYEVRMFVGETWKVSSRFTVFSGEATATLAP
jgi:hypothetical protein